MARKSKADKNSDLHIDILKNYNQAVDADKENREMALDDVAFTHVAGEQYDAQYNTNSDRPKFEINKIAVSVQQFLGEFSRQDMSIKVTPYSGEANTDLAKTYEGLIRNIQKVSGFKKIQGEALKETSVAGIAAWRITTDYMDDDSFDQDVKIEFIPSAVNSVWFDPVDKDLLKRNARYCIVANDMSREEFKEKYPDSALASFDQNPNYQVLNRRDWITENTVRVVDYYYRVPVKTKRVMLNDGSSHLIDDIKDILDELAEQGVEIVKERKVTYYKIMWTRSSGTEILEDPQELANRKYLPVIPVYGYAHYVDNNLTYRGIVRNARDSQRIYNYAISAQIEAIVNSPKDPIVYDVNGVGEYQDEWRNFNVSNTNFLPYDFEGANGQVPIRLGTSPVNAALSQQLQIASGDINETLGTSAASLGQTDLSGGMNTPSGVAIGKIQQQSNLGRQILIQNMADAVEHTGNILLDLLPRVYDTERQARIVNADGSTQFVPINKETVDVQTGETVLYNDLNQGKYNLSVSVGAGYDTERAETLAMIEALSANNPMLMPLVSDLLVKNVPFAESEELTTRIRKQMLQQGLVEPNEEEQAEIDKQPPPEPDPLEQLQFKQAQLSLEALAASVDKTEMELIKMRMDMDKTASETELTEAKTATEYNNQIMEQLDRGMTEQREAQQAYQTQMNDAIGQLERGIAPNIQAAIKNVRPGMYTDENGELLNMDDNGNLSKVEMNAPPIQGEGDKQLLTDLPNGIEGV